MHNQIESSDPCDSSECYTPSWLTQGHDGGAAAGGGAQLLRQRREELKADQERADEKQRHLDDSLRVNTPEPLYLFTGLVGDRITSACCTSERAPGESCGKGCVTRTKRSIHTTKRTTFDE